MPNINLKIKVDGKEAIAELQLAENKVKELYQSFKYGKQDVITQIDLVLSQLCENFTNSE